MSEGDQPEGVSIHAGFPNPASDKTLGGLDLNRLLIKNSVSTYLFRLRGNEWEKFGIYDGDIAVVDRAQGPRRGDLVIWWGQEIDDFAISKYATTKPNATIWGVVTSVIHQFRKSTHE